MENSIIENFIDVSGEGLNGILFVACAECGYFFEIN